MNTRCQFQLTAIAVTEDELGKSRCRSDLAQFSEFCDTCLTYNLSQQYPLVYSDTTLPSSMLNNTDYAEKSILKQSVMVVPHLKDHEAQYILVLTEGGCACMYFCVCACEHVCIHGSVHLSVTLFVRLVCPMYGFCTMNFKFSTHISTSRNDTYWCSGDHLEFQVQLHAKRSQVVRALAEP